MDYDSDNLYCMIEISLFPMSDAYSSEVGDFINALSSLGFDNTTSDTSTILRGSYDEIMPAITVLMRRTLSDGGKKAVVLKVLNGE